MAEFKTIPKEGRSPGVGSSPESPTDVFSGWEGVLTTLPYVALAVLLLIAYRMFRIRRAWEKDDAPAVPRFLFFIPSPPKMHESSETAEEKRARRREAYKGLIDRMNRDILRKRRKDRLPPGG